MTMTTNERSKATKKALVPIFGKDHVRVNHGRGTAYAWIDRHVRIPKPADCSCELARLHRGAYVYCEACHETIDVARNVIREACRGIEYGIWYRDDGFGTECEEVNDNIVFDDEYCWRFDKDK